MKLTMILIVIISFIIILRHKNNLKENISSPINTTDKIPELESAQIKTSVNSSDKITYKYEIRIYLNVPFTEKEHAKSFGAKWNNKRKNWYVEQFDVDVIKWLPDVNTLDYSLYSEQFYIAESTKQCWNCNKDTPVFAIFINNYESSEYVDLHIGSNSVDISEFFEWTLGFFPNFVEPYQLQKDTIDHLNKLEHPVAKRIVAINTTYRNTQYCYHCGKKQGNFYLFDEIDSPFTILYKSQLKRIKLYKVDFPLKAMGSVGYQSTLEYVTIENFKEVCTIT